MPAGTPEPEASVTPATALVGTVLWGAVTVASLPLLLMSPMLFDSPGSQDNRYLWAVVSSLASLPVLCVVSIVGGWATFAVTRRWSTARHRTGRRLRRLFFVLPLASFAALVATIALFARQCHGSFNCR